MNPIRLQRIESAATAAAVAVAFITLGYPWWWLPVLFIGFDISAIGYLRGPRWGSVLYNLGHSYAVPTLLAAVWAIQSVLGQHPQVLGIVIGAWVFHIAVDRALGYGLKYPDAFTSTHLSPAERAKEASHVGYK